MACIVCKKLRIPFDGSRSFHKFPKDNDLKAKWMNAIGNFSVKKTSIICSDHFDAASYHDTDGYTTLRRLLSNAVPRIVSSTEVTNKFTESNDKTVLEHSQGTESHHNIKIEENEISHSEENTQIQVSESINVVNTNLICQSNVNNSNNRSDEAVAEHPSLVLCISPVETAEYTTCYDLKISHVGAIRQQHHLDYSDNTNNLQREIPFQNKTNQSETKKIRYRGKFKTYCFTREKFSSDAAWEDFQEFATFTKNKIAAVVKKNLRKQKKLNRLRKVIEKLKMANIFTVGEYLQVMNNRVI